MSLPLLQSEQGFTGFDQAAGSAPVPTLYVPSNLFCEPCVREPLRVSGLAQWRWG